MSSSDSPYSKLVKPLTRGWTVTSEPIGPRSEVFFDSVGCLSIELKLKEASPNVYHTIGLNVYGVDLPELGGFKRLAYESGIRTIDCVSKKQVNLYRLGGVTTDGNGKAKFMVIISLTPGIYDLQLWVVKGALGSELAICYKSGETFGDSARIIIRSQSDVVPYLLRRLRAKRYPRLVRRMRRQFTSVLESITAWKDMISLHKMVPQLRNFDHVAKKARKILQPYYEEYILNVSTERMTISLELAEFLIVVCGLFRPRSILDLGSGFSSVALRLHAMNTAPTPVIWSIDDSSKWLEETRKFLAAHHLSTERLLEWDSFAQENHDTFDLIVNDMGRYRLRMATLRNLVTFARAGSFIILDDMQIEPYKEYVKDVMNQSRFKCYSLKRITKDKFGRYSMLAVKPGAGFNPKGFFQAL